MPGPPVLFFLITAPVLFSVLKIHGPGYSCINELAHAQLIRPLRTLAARLAALRTPLPEKSSDFGRCFVHMSMQKWAIEVPSFHVDQPIRKDQSVHGELVTSSPPALAPQGRSASFSGQCAHA